MRKKSTWRLVCALLLLIASAVVILCMIGTEQKQGLFFWVAVTLLATGALWTIGEGILLHRNFWGYISEMNSTLSDTAAQVPEQMPIPTAILSEGKELLWYNSSFRRLIAGDTDCRGRNIQHIIPLDFRKLLEKGFCDLALPGHAYRVSISEHTKDGTKTSLLCFQDISAMVELRNRYFNAKLCVIHVMVDNYDDLFSGARQSERASLMAELENLIDRFFQQYHCITCPLSDDHFMVLIEAQYFRTIQNEKFPILDAARKILVSGKTPLTLSIGAGYDGESFAQNELYARQSLDMAMGRGGDQAAVKTLSGFDFFGGVSKAVEHRSKTRYRYVAKALQEIIQSNDKVIVMGHRYTDLDAVGAAVGVAFIAQEQGRPAYVAINAEATLAAPLVKRLQKECPDLLLTPEEAVEACDDHTVVVIVDTVNKELVESKELYQKAKQVVVIDHHRKMANCIDDMLLLLHDPLASSAAELVTEMLAYLELHKDLPGLYAESLLAGIMLDTKNFVMQTGVHTFEAAALLRECGADPIVVKTLFSATMGAYRQRSRMVVDAELHGRCAITVARDECQDIQIIASQTADELLGIEGVDASFVIYPNRGASCISARSLGKMNVQVIMEQLGGGGHQTMAAVQRKDCSPTELRTKLIGVLDAMAAAEQTIGSAAAEEPSTKG